MPDTGYMASLQFNRLHLTMQPSFVAVGIAAQQQTHGIMMKKTGRHGDNAYSYYILHSCWHLQVSPKWPNPENKT